VADHAFDVTTEERWQSTTVTGHHRTKTTLQALVNPLTAEPNAVQGEQPLYPADNTSPLRNKVLALTLDALGIFLLDRRNTHSRGDVMIARKPSSKDSGHLFGIKPICFSQPTPARLEKARRIKHDRADASANEQSREPKSVISDFVTERDLKRTRHVPHSPRAPSLQDADQAIHVTGAHPVNARSSTVRWGERTDPSRFAEFERHATDVVDGKLGSHEQISLLITEVIIQEAMIRGLSAP
jgi:hypothetical protein